MKKIIIIGNPDSNKNQFIYNNFGKVTKINKSKFVNNDFKIYKYNDIDILKTIGNVDKIYFVCTYRENYSNFPICEEDLLLCQKLLTFLYVELGFTYILSIIIMPEFNDTKIKDDVFNYFKIMDSVNINIIKYDAPVTEFYTKPINIKKLYYKYIYKTVITDIQEYMIENDLYPDCNNYNIFQRLYYSQTYKGIVLYKNNNIKNDSVVINIVPKNIKGSQNIILNNSFNFSNKSININNNVDEIIKKDKINLEYKSVIYYDIMKTKVFYEGYFYDNYFRKGKFYSLSGELLFKGRL